MHQRAQQSQELISFLYSSKQWTETELKQLVITAFYWMIDERRPEFLDYVRGITESREVKS